SHLAASGHSHSGGPAFYILTHSKTFAAMSIGSGYTDLVSGSLSLTNEYSGTNSLKWIDIPLGNLWQNKEKWLAASPIMDVDNVTTPVLMFQNKKDVKPNDGVEM